MNRSPQRGVALVVTLIMLSVVTFMAVFFLTVSRRERSSVTVTADTTDARLMADMARERATADVLARIMARSNELAYDFMVSTNFVNAVGFDTGSIDYTNVAYTYPSGLPLSPAHQIQVLTNLLYDPRVPVFFGTSTTNEFRFYHDLNRNRQFETNGWQAVLLTNGAPLLGADGQVVSNFFVGDPEWIGVLEHPGQPHSSSNRFVGRMCFVVVPESKTLDFNYVHNQAKRIAANASGFVRNQGVGPWELNLAAFLHDLNTNSWPAGEYRYLTNLTAASSGTAFLDALRLVNWRYSNSFANLRSAEEFLGADGARLVRDNQVDDYSDGPLQLGEKALPPDTLGLLDVITQPWSGSENPRALFDIQELFLTNRTWAAFTNRLRLPGTSRGSYDRYTFYRMMSQMGVDSAPASPGRINLNFDNVYNGTVYSNWSAMTWFTNAAELMLRNQFGIGISGIQVYSNSIYGPEVHRILQLAANIYDYGTNVGPDYPYFPSVFRPVLTNANSTNIFIAGYTEVTNLAFLNDPWLDLSVPADRARIGGGSVNVFGLPLVVGAKKGLPNFNEFAFQTAVQVTRKLQLAKRSLNDLAPRTNQLYVLSISNFFGAECWNSYTQAVAAFPRALEMRITNRCTITLSNRYTRLLYTNLVSSAVTNLAANTWKGGDFRVPLTNLVLLLTNSAYYFNPPRFQALTTQPEFDATPGFPTPDWQVYVTNRLQYILIDKANNRILDFVNLTNINSALDITDALVGNANRFADRQVNVGTFWRTNRVNGGIPEGVAYQVYASMSNVLSLTEWNNYGVGTGKSPRDAIDEFRIFLGLDPLFNTNMTRPPSLVHQVPFTPTRKFYQTLKWQVNDPLVHYLTADLGDPFLTDTNTLEYAVPPTRISTNSNLGRLNDRYKPWGGHPTKDSSNDKFAVEVGVKDPLIRRPDDWDFPTNRLVGKFPNIGWLGKVHRGSAWQTVYLKSKAVNVRLWTEWANSPLTHPTNDWRLMDVFTTALHPNASRGLLSVNQTNLAAWSAVLSGVNVLSNSLPDSGLNKNTVPEFNPVVVDPGSTQLLAMVEGIIKAKLRAKDQVFRHMGDVLSAPELTLQSPFLNTTNLAQANFAISDAAYERIPQQVLSLLKPDQPRLVIYAFGQSLKPADRSVVLTPGPTRGLCTNYQITGEFATKSQLRIENAPRQPRVVIESYNILPPE